MNEPLYNNLLDFVEERADLFVVPKLGYPNLEVVVDSNGGIGNSIRFPKSQIYYDGLYSLVCAFSRVLPPETFLIPTALVSFDLEVSLPSLDIVQIQRLEGMAQHLKGADRWRNRLIGIVERFAHRLDIPFVRIKPASENEWVKSGVLDLSIAKAMYDTTARRLKYDPPKSEVPWWVKRVME